MKDTRKHFSYDFLVRTAYEAIEYELSKLHTVSTGDSKFCEVQPMRADLNAAMAALAMFSLKFPSMLQFDVRSRQNNYYLEQNLKLFGVKKVPCDTYMRERLDEQEPKAFRGPFTAIFSLLQNAKVLQYFLFLEKFYLISIDATDLFSSSAIHCANCCDWFNSADNKEAIEFETQHKVKKGRVVEKYKYMKEVPLSDSGSECKVNVVRQITESSKGVQKWMWVTDLDVNRETVPLIAKGGRSRWKIENETFNTLKNQGYEFEHNYGHGYKNLNTVLTFLMLIAFLIDQCLQHLNKKFEAAYATYQAKYAVWEQLRSIMILFIVPSLDGVYELMVKPPGRAA